MLVELRDALEFLYADSTVSPRPCRTTTTHLARQAIGSVHILLNGLTPGRPVRLALRRAFVTDPLVAAELRSGVVQQDDAACGRHSFGVTVRIPGLDIVAVVNHELQRVRRRIRVDDGNSDPAVPKVSGQPELGSQSIAIRMHVSRKNHFLKRIGQLPEEGVAVLINHRRVLRQDRRRCIDGCTEHNFRRRRRFAHDVPL